MLAGYGWIVTADHVTDPDDYANGYDTRVGWTGPRNIDPAIEARLRAGEGTPFRLYSDVDDVADFLDYEGRIIIKENSSDPDAEFGPLDDLGRPDCGSTTIKYKNDAGKWIAL